MSKIEYPLLNLASQRGLHRCFTSGLAGNYDLFFEVEDYNFCHHTMRDDALTHMDATRNARPSIKFGLSEFEWISDDPRKSVRGAIFKTGMGERFLSAHNGGILFNLETGEGDIQTTRECFEAELKRRMFGTVLREWFSRVDHPDLMDLKRQFIAKVMRSEKKSGWDVDPEGSS